MKRIYLLLILVTTVISCQKDEIVATEPIQQIITNKEAVLKEFQFQKLP